MKRFSEIRSRLDEDLCQEILQLVENGDGDDKQFRGVGGYGRGGYCDPHHLTGHGQLLDVLIRKVSQLGVENDDLAREVAEKLGLDLPADGGVAALLQRLKLHSLGACPDEYAHFDQDSEEAKREVLNVASKMVHKDSEGVRERPLAPEGSEVVRAPEMSRRPPRQGTGHPGDPVGFVAGMNESFDEEAVRERFRLFEAKILKEQTWSRQKGSDHILLFKGKVEAYTGKDGLWTDYEKVKIPTVYTVEVYWNAEYFVESGDVDFLDGPTIDVRIVSPKYDYRRAGLIYTDEAFEKGINKLAKANGYRSKIYYTEQGMQGDDWVSMEAGDGRDLRKRFPEIVARALAEEINEETLAQKAGLSAKELSDKIATIRREDPDIEQKAAAGKAVGILAPDAAKKLFKEDRKTDKELKSGLESFVQDARAARKLGNNRLSMQIRRVIMQVVQEKGLDVRQITKLLDEGYVSLHEVRISLDEDITPILQQIVANHQAMAVKFDNGKRRTVDAFTANVLIKVHDALSGSTQEKFRRMLSKNDLEFNRVVTFAFKSVK